MNLSGSDVVSVIIVDSIGDCYFSLLERGDW